MTCIKHFRVKIYPGFADEESMLLPEKDRKLCPNIEAPLDNCYCNAMRSQDVEKAIYYCANNYDSCEIYMESCTDLLQTSTDIFLNQDGCTETSS